MYARKVSLAIDGKAMYFGGRLCPSDPGLRPSDVGLRSGIPRKSLQKLMDLVAGQRGGTAAV
jgi:hypothetical protein